MSTRTHVRVRIPRPRRYRPQRAAVVRPRSPSPPLLLALLPLALALLVVLLVALLAPLPAHSATTPNPAYVRIASVTWSGTTALVTVTTQPPRFSAPMKDVFVHVYRRPADRPHYVLAANPGTSPTGYLWETTGRLYRFVSGSDEPPAELAPVEGRSVALGFAAVDEVCGDGECIAVVQWPGGYVRAAVPARR